MFKRKQMVHVVTSALVAAATWSVQVALAQQVQLDEIIVTAQKKVENLQNVPISIRVMDASALEKASIASMTDLNTSVSGFSAQPYPLAAESLMFAVRGIQPNGLEPTQDDPTAMHINGVYVPRGNGLNMVTMADLERIEILKGPQGTLVGRNSAAGAVNIITAKPNLGEFGFKQQINLAQRGQLLSKTVVNLPLAEQFATKLTYINNSRDSEGIKNNGIGAQFGKRDGDAWRLDLRWKPRDTVTVDYGYDTAKVKYQPTPYQCLVPGILSPAAPCGKEFMSFQTGQVTGVPDSMIETSGHTLSVEWQVAPALTLRSITGKRTLDDNSVSDFFQFASGAFVAQAAIPAANLVAGSTGRIRQEQVSQEFQFIGRPSESLNYTAGFFFFREKGSDGSGDISTGGNSPLAFATPLDATFASILSSQMSGLPVPVGTMLYTPQGPFNVEARNSSWAMFGQLSWRPDILDHKLEVVPGLRYTKDKREMTSLWYDKKNITLVAPTPAYAGLTNAMPLFFPNAYTFSAPGGCAFGGTPPNCDAIHVEKRFSSTTPSLTLQYHLDKASMAYGKVAKGYLSGGFNALAIVDTDARAGFGPEVATSIEAGFKGEFMDRRLRTNLAVYQTKFSDQQIAVQKFPPGSQEAIYPIMNAGKSTYKGMELDLAFAVTRALRLGFSYAHLQSKFDEITDPGSGRNMTSEYVKILPKHSYTAAVDYRFPGFGLPGKLDLNLSYSYTDKQTFATVDLKTNNLGLTTDRYLDLYTAPAFGVWNGRLALNQIDVGPGKQGDLSVALWGRNLTDKKYLSYVMGNSLGGLAAASLGKWGEPRTLGIDVIYRY